VDAYRSPDQTPLCCSCGSASLTPSTKFDTSEGFAQLYFHDPTIEPSFFGGGGMRTFSIDRARVCLDCGHIMLSFGKKKLEELRDEIASLKPVATESAMPQKRPLK
jgi:hypothetical protein